MEKQETGRRISQENLARYKRLELAQSRAPEAAWMETMRREFA